MVKRGFVIIYICLAVISQLSAQDLATVIAKSEKAIGLKARKKLKSLETSGHLVMRDAEAKIPFKVIQKKPDGLRIETSIFGFKAIQTYDGESAWRLTPTQGMEALKTDPREMEFLSNVLAIDGPFSVDNSENYSLKYGGKTEYNNTKFELVLWNSKTQRLKYYINPDTWLIDIVRYEYQKNGGWYSMEYRVKTYQDFQGAKFPLDLVAMRNGVEMIYLTVTKLNLPDKIDDSLFDKPGYQ